MHPDPELERLIDRELAELRSPRAPRTLAPRVMHAVRLQQRTEIGAWFTWPVLWQVSSLAVMFAVFAGVLNGLPIAAGALGLATSVLEWTWVGTAVRKVSDIVGAAAVVWRVVQPVVIVMLVFLATMLAASAAFGAALRSVVLGGTSRP
jgi:hypothetical protein